MRPFPRSLLALVAGIALALAGVGAANAIGLRPSFVGESRPASIEHLRPAGVVSATGYVPVTPCRIFDTRSATDGPLSTAGARAVQVVGTGGFPAQGGANGGCGIPSEASAVTVSITAVDPSGGGFLRAWPHGTTPPTATVLNWLTEAKGGVTTGATLPLGNGKIDVRAFGNTTDLVIDYYVEPIVAKVNANGDLDTWSTGIVFAGRSTTGTYILQATHPVVACHVTATPLNTALKATAYATSGSQLFVVINDATGTAKDSPFTVSAVC